MLDFSKTLADFHKKHVALSNDQQGAMMKRRDANLKRIKDGLEELKKPAYVDSISQGGYMMETMVQPPEGDEDSRYDIDEGIVFETADTKTPSTTKEWVRAALEKKGSNFKEAPVAKPKCVRVVYSDGYQCDFPVLRRSGPSNARSYEIAIKDEWVASDPRAMNKWFEDRVTSLSPKDDGASQLRRIVRYVKYFARAHGKRLRAKLPAGLVLTALCVENYVAAKGRDDVSVYETLKNLQNRSENLPVVANEKIVSNDKDKDRIKRLREAAKYAVEALKALEEKDATEDNARSAWKDVFRHSYFKQASKEAAMAAFPTAKAADDDRTRRAEELAARIREQGRATPPHAADGDGK